MGLYIRTQDVVLRLEGKVAFSQNPSDANKMSYALLNRLIQEAEGQVEMDLSPRYVAPLQTDAGQPFSQLPLRPTQEYLKTICELKAVMRVLQTDFGRGSAVSGDAYYNSQKEQYEEMVKKLIEKDEFNAFKYPPLSGLQLNYQNTQGDDGFKGMVMNTSLHGNVGDYPAQQVQSPGENFWTITPQDLRSNDWCGSGENVPLGYG